MVIPFSRRPKPAGIASLLSDAQDWHPPGALFVAFALAACASIPSEPADVGIAALVAGSSAAFAVVVGGLGATGRYAGRPRPSGPGRRGSPSL